ncbi:RTC4-like domain-containing protein [Favolaschia claudopus]|uniref:Restriction of telomere capping protein 4 n=1 Tax=Favolaschia claudopus TaxID=2862362 RepID=A0AAW0DX37_9AGAR
MESRRYAARLKVRPGSQPPRRGVLNEDLGSGFSVPSKRVQEVLPVDDDSDDDDLDLLSGKNSSPPISPPRPASSQPVQQKKEKRDMDDVIKGLKFNKIKKKSGSDVDDPTTTSKENAHRAPEKKKTPAVHPIVGDTKQTLTRPLRDNSTTRNQNHSEVRVGAKRRADSQYSRDVKPQRSKSGASGKSQPVASTSQSNSFISVASSQSSIDDSPGRNDRNQFPTLSPLSGSKGKGREIDRPLPQRDVKKGKAKIQGREGPKFTRPLPTEGLSPLSSPTKAQNDFLPSPLGTPLKSAVTRFPAPSPLRSEEQAMSNKLGGKRKVQPFPMELNNQTPEGSPSSSKRQSGSDNEDERDRKRYKNQPVVLAGTYEEEDSELLFLSPGTDPKTLCPYCDTLLPAQPTPLLTRLLEETFKKSYRDARPANPLGRKAPMNVFIGVCQRHRFESETLPEAEMRGWPKFIDWEGLQGRVLALKRDLLGILRDPGDPIVYGNEDDAEEPQPPVNSQPNKGPRMLCIFWKDLVKELKAKGSKGVKGVHGQFANFEKTQPGYYGELGSMIIHQTLYDMFPLSSIDPDLVSPLTPNEFIQRILVPEVGMRLVMEDMDLNQDRRTDKKRAVAVLRESASYGVAMFPADGGEWGGVSGKKLAGGDAGGARLAEQMVMERARKRRKELEIEEGEEEERWMQQQAEKEREKSEVVKQKKRAKKKDSEAASAAADPPAPSRPRPRPVPKNKEKPSVLTDTASDMDTDTSSDVRPSKEVADFDMDTITQSLEAEQLVPTPKPPSRRVDKLATALALDSDSDSEFPLGVLVSTPRLKARSTSKPAPKKASIFSETFSEPEVESDTAEVGGYSRPRSPSASLTGSKRSTRGSSVVDLCSSSEDGGGPSTRGPSNARKPNPPIPRRKLSKPSRILSSSEEDNATEATPRAKRPLKDTTCTSNASSFRPLDVARARVPSVKKSREKPGEQQDWLVSMAKDVSESDDEASHVGSQRSQDSHSWLLDDISET